MGRVLLTGATGFVGRHLVTALLAAGHALTLPVRTEATLPAAWRGNSDIRIVVAGDLAEADLAPALADVETVVHVAGLAGGRATEADFTHANTTTTKRLVAQARQAEVAAFIMLGSIMATTGNTSDTIIDDATPPAPAGAYGRSKLAAEEHVAAFAELGRLAVSLRPPLVVGADARGNWKSLQALAATGLPLPFASLDGARSFIGIDSLAEAIVLLCGRAWEPALSGAYCLADPERLSLPEVVFELRAGMSLPPRLFACPPAAFAALGAVTGRQQQLASLTGSLRVDATRFYRSFGFAPSLPIRAAMRQSGAAFLAAKVGHTTP